MERERAVAAKAQGSSFPLGAVSLSVPGYEYNLPEPAIWLRDDTRHLGQTKNE
jgi:hypothetical protein